MYHPVNPSLRPPLCRFKGSCGCSGEAENHDGYTQRTLQEHKELVKQRSEMLYNTVAGSSWCSNRMLQEHMQLVRPRSGTLHSTKVCHPDDCTGCYKHRLGQLVRPRLGMLHRIQVDHHGDQTACQDVTNTETTSQTDREKQRVPTTVEKLIIMMIKQDVTNTETTSSTDGEKQRVPTTVEKLIILSKFGEVWCLFSFIQGLPTNSEGRIARNKSNSSSVTCRAISTGCNWGEKSCQSNQGVQSSKCACAGVHYMKMTVMVIDDEIP